MLQSDAIFVLIYAVIFSPFLALYAYFLWLKSFIAGAGVNSPVLVGAHVFQTIVAAVVIPIFCFAASFVTLALGIGFSLPSFTICCGLLSAIFYLISWVCITWQEMRHTRLSRENQNAVMGGSAVLLFLVAFGPSEIVGIVDLLFVAIVLTGFVRGRLRSAEFM